MTNLTRIAITTRKIIKFSTLAIIILIVGRLLFGLGLKVYKHYYPDPPPAPTVGFDKLPKLAFPKQENLPQMEYKVETVDGELPNLGIQAKVYFMPKPTQTQLNLDIAKQKAAGMGFVSDGQQVSPTVYKFTSPKAPSTLQINTVSNVFSLSFDFSSDSSPLSSLPPNPELAVSKVKSFLSSANLLPEDLTGPTTHQFLKIEGGQIANALSLSEANLTKVNLYRKSFDNLPSVSRKGTEANIWFFVSGANDRDRQVVVGEYHYFPVDESRFETYPIKTARQALEDLAAGKGYIVSLGNNTEGKVTIRNVYLGYYDSGEETEFYQPVVVFEGDNSFVAYSPAVAEEWYRN